MIEFYLSIYPYGFNIEHLLCGKILRSMEHFRKIMRAI